MSKKFSKGNVKRSESTLDQLYQYGEFVFRFAISRENSDDQEVNEIHNRRCQLLANTKAAVKRVMEEAATKKFVYFDNDTVNGLCSAIESCLLDGLQKRSVGLFEDNLSLGLLKKITRDCEAAVFILNRIRIYNEQVAANSDQFGGSTSNGMASWFFHDSITSNDSSTGAAAVGTSGISSNGSIGNFGGNTYQYPKSPGTISLPGPLIGLFNKSKPCHIKYLWIKLALVNKKMMEVIECLMSKHNQFYEETSILAMPLWSSTFLNLIAGPCSLDFSLVKPSDHIWSDPDAIELLDRHRIHSNAAWFDGECQNGVANVNNASTDNSGNKTEASSTRSYNNRSVTNMGGRRRGGGMECGDVVGSHQRDPRYNLYKLRNRSGQLSQSQRYQNRFNSNSFSFRSRPSLKIHYQSGSLSHLQDGIGSPGTNASVSSIGSADKNSSVSQNLFHPKTYLSGPAFQNSNAGNCLGGGSSGGPPMNIVAKEYVESLHQNMKSVLLYGKNNVLVQPKEVKYKIPGYLSLHQTGDRLRLKWTPNQLMNCNPVNFSLSDNNDEDQQQTQLSQSENTNPITPRYEPLDPSYRIYWDSALLINMEDIVYLYCHDRGNYEGRITLVCQDGVQHPPFYFPPGNNLLQFLECLENGLTPKGFLDPPLVQAGDEKTFPKDVTIRKQSTDSVPSSPDIANVQNQKTRSIGMNLLSNLNSSFLKKRTSDDKSAESDVTVMERKESNSELTDNPTNHIDNTNCDLVFRICYKPIQSSINSGSESSQIGESYYYCSPNSDHHHTHNHHDNDNSTESTDAKKRDKHDHVNCSSIDTLCCVMRRQILSRAFYGWLQYYRNQKTVRTKFADLVLTGTLEPDVPNDASDGLTEEVWNHFLATQEPSLNEIYRLIYFGGCADSIRSQVWPRLLGHYPWTATKEEIRQLNAKVELEYEKILSQWRAMEVIIIQRDNEANSHLEASSSNSLLKKPTQLQQVLVRQQELIESISDPHQHYQEQIDRRLSSSDTSITTDQKEHISYSKCDMVPSQDFYSTDTSESENVGSDLDNQSSVPHSSPNDFVFTEKQIHIMTENMHWIDKDVERCDRNNPFFSNSAKNRGRGQANLRKLRNIMITWVWCNLDLGYVQGMCDLLAPLLVVLDDSESLSYICFTKLMHRMIDNFPHMGQRMDQYFSMMASLLQILDHDLYEHMCSDNDVTSLFVTYRWFLLDFKRELPYSDVFVVWETIWSAEKVSSNQFSLFLALSLLQYYRDIILDNNMEKTDVIKFFNEMAERHHVSRLLYIARDLIESIRDLLQSKK